MIQETTKFLYFHIPKTGGVAFRQILENSVNDREILHFRTPSEIATCTDSALSQYRLVHGHFNFQHIKHLKSFKTIVTLRDPVTRCLSTYNFWRGLDVSDPVWPEKSKLQIQRAQSLTFEEMLEHPDPFTSQHFDNVQTRILCGVTNPAIKITEGHLDIAIKNLLSFDFIATTEDLEYCKMLMCKKFSIYYPETPIRLNTSKNKSDIEAGLQRKILEKNSLDAQILSLIHKKGLMTINKI